MGMNYIEHEVKHNPTSYISVKRYIKELLNETAHLCRLDIAKLLKR